jgi:membrane protein YqaA with SNARE-associated domain
MCGNTQQCLRQSGRDYPRLPRKASNLRTKTGWRRTQCVGACKNARMDETLSLWALFASSFLAATLLPGGSEVVLFGVLKVYPQQYWPALAVATIGNTLGGMSSYVIGRVIPPKTGIKQLGRVKKYGAAALLLAWVPILGDPLCVAAGWLRINPWLSALAMAAGKLARYLVVAGIAV